METRGTQENTRGTEKTQWQDNRKNKRMTTTKNKIRQNGEIWYYTRKIRGRHEVDKRNPGGTQGRSNKKTR